MTIRTREVIPVLLILLSCGEDAPSRKFTISGFVRENGQGIPDADVLNTNSPKVTTLTDGSYRIEGFDPGSYSLRVQKPGYTFTPEIKGVVISDSDSEENNFEGVSGKQVVHNGRSWDLFNADVYSIKTNNSSTLQLDLEQNVIWYQGSQGGLIHRSVAGDFTITARVTAVRKSDNSQPASCNVCLGGLMARNPQGIENYVHIVTGVTPNGLGFETKNTTNNVSPYTATGDSNARHDLRIRRTGSTFTMYQKLTSETDWKAVATFNRPDLPHALQVGVNIYTAQSGAVADLSVTYENIVIE